MDFGQCKATKKAFPEEKRPFCGGGNLSTSSTVIEAFQVCFLIPSPIMSDRETSFGDDAIDDDGRLDMEHGRGGRVNPTMSDHSDES